LEVERTIINQKKNIYIIKMSNVITFLTIFLITIIVQSLMVMVIWNNVLIKKFPLSKIQKLNFFDALAITVLTSILFGSTYISGLQN
jgi:hypothetical protein